MASLHCQKCRTPLNVDGSLQDLNPASFKLLADAAPTLEAKTPDPPRSAAAKERKQRYDEVSQQSGTSLNRRHSTQTQRMSGKSQQPPDMSYVMLSDSQIGPAGYDEQPSLGTKRRKSAGQKLVMSRELDGGDALSQRMETAMRLFEILSARSDVDHPICSECTEMVLDSLQKHQASVLRERDAYVGFQKQAQEALPTDAEKLQTERDLEEARERERKALRELEALETEKARMEDEIAALDAEAEQLDEEEEKFWRERNQFTTELAAIQEERDSLQNQLAHDHALLESIQRANVYNDTFCIAHDGLFATINGLRLGKLNEHPVEWPEINAALGQTVLLLSVVTEKLGYKFKNHRLVPVGSTSKIIVETRQPQGGEVKQKVHELYSSGDLPLGLGGLFQGKFDTAIVEFLCCLKELGDHVQRTTTDGTKTMPYKIEKDKIGDVSIALRFGQEEAWTRACKYLLTCCKYLLAHASRVDDGKRTAR